MCGIGDITVSLLQPKNEKKEHDGNKGSLHRILGVRAPIGRRRGGRGSGSGTGKFRIDGGDVTQDGRGKCAGVAQVVDHGGQGGVFAKYPRLVCLTEASVVGQLPLRDGRCVLVLTSRHTGGNQIGMCRCRRI